MRSGAVCCTVFYLKAIVEANKTIQKLKAEIQEYEGWIDSYADSAQDFAVETYVKGLTKQKVRDALRSEQSCMDLIQELERLVESDSTNNRSRAYNRDSQLGASSRGDAIASSLMERYSGPSSPEYSQGYDGCPDWGQDFYDC